MNDRAHHKPGRPHTYIGLIDWLNDHLYNALGPPRIGPYEEIVDRIAEATCPVCGASMQEHSIDHSTPNAILHCPRPPLPEHEDRAVNELGMELRE